MSSRADRPLAPLPPASQNSMVVDTQQLLRELEEAHRHLALHAVATTQQPLPEQEAPMLAVARLIPGVDKGTWERLRNQLPLHGWCAVEVCVHTAHTTVCSTVLADCLPCGSHSDPLTGALLAAPLLQQLEREVVRAARGQSPLSVATFALEPQWAQHHGQSAVHAAALNLAQAVQCRCLSCDSLGRLDLGSFALILPGAGLFKAQAMVEEVLATCAAMDMAAPFLAGIAGGTGTTCQCTHLLEQASSALQEVLNSGGDTVRVFRPRAEALEERRTLVQSHEKRFLFSGGE